jgi:hypothetical protein
MDIKPDLNDLVQHAGVKGMKWDPSKKKTPAEVSSAWKSLMLPKDQVLPNDQTGAKMDIGRQMSVNAINKVEGIFSKYANMTLSSIFGNSKSNEQIKYRKTGDKQVNDMVKQFKKQGYKPMWAPGSATPTKEEVKNTKSVSFVTSVNGKVNKAEKKKADDYINSLKKKGYKPMW